MSRPDEKAINDALFAQGVQVMAELRAKRDRQADLLARASTIIETALGVMGEPSDESPESEAWFSDAGAIRAEIAEEAKHT